MNLPAVNHINISVLKRNKFIIENGCHDKNTLLIVTGGSFWIKMNGKEFTLRENAAFFFKRKEKFKRKIISPLTLIFVELSNDMGLKSGELIFKNKAHFAGTVLLLYNSLNENLPLSVSRHFVINIFDQLYVENHSDILVNNIYSLETKKFIEYVNNNFGSKIQINDFLDVVNMTHTGFILKFKKETGETPLSYITSVRINKAKSLLSSSDIKIYEIAYLCGYDNPYYFSNTFKKVTGMSPLEFRKSTRKL